MFAKLDLLFALTLVIISISLATDCDQCGLNEEYTTCGSACPPTCGDPPEICTEKCIEDCFCRKGYIRRNDKCISIEECKKLTTCKRNEHWTNCGTACPEICAQPKPTVCTKQCVQGCFCNPGYVRRNSTCISEEECKTQTTCKRNEHWTNCGTACPEICAQPKPTICTEQCVQGCFCNPGYVRRNGTCISEEECKKQTTCKRNEHWTNCGTACPEICAQPKPTVCTKQCVQGCFCNPGYVRRNGTCISEEECKTQTTCKRNEHWTNCGTACPEICAQPKPTVCTKQCVQGCFCNPGYVRRNGTCISEEECKKLTTCDENEEWTNCGTVCPQICGEIKSEYCITRCVKGCFCKPGYVRRRNGKCISEEECKKITTCKRNEHWSSCGPCPNICGETTPMICPAACFEGCFCNKGYVTLNGQCVSEAECKNYTRCNKNEHWENCGTACPEICGKSKPDVCTNQCVQGCFCDPGYVRRNGTCISEEECKKLTTCNENEEWTNCGTARPQICGEPKPENCTKQCVPGCFCKPGYVRGRNGRCISEEECKKHMTCNENEEWTNCGTACPHICREPKPGICTRQCVPGCFCKPGTIRRRNGKCISYEECEKHKTCNRNEHWSNCGSSCPRICNQSPPKFCPALCVEGCFCNEGYVRLNGQCVPESKCNEHILCKKNEYWTDCGFACPPKCGEPLEPCRAQCIPGCFCKSGFILRNGTCISDAECNEYIKCKNNEQLN